MKLSQIGERALIEKIKKWIPRPASSLGPVGDDCAIWNQGNGQVYLLTTDSMVEGVHFDFRWTTPADLGHKLLATNLSDIAAKGGFPKLALITLAVPANASELDVQSFYQGLSMLAKRTGVSVAGGETVRSPRDWLVSLSLIGSMKARDCVERRGAKAGDLIMVTGTLGDAALAWQGIHKKKHPNRAALYRLLRPEARLSEGQWLAAQAHPTAMMDCSDGLMVTVDEICRQSKVGAEVDLCGLPISLPAMDMAASLHTSASRAACFGGDDYELVLTMAPTKAPRLQQEFHRRFQTALTPVGKIVKNRQLTVLKGRKTLTLRDVSGYDAFSKRKGPWPFD